jgi:hypothetical protein
MDDYGAVRDPVATLHIAVEKAESKELCPNLVVRYVRDVKHLSWTDAREVTIHFRPT